MSDPYSISDPVAHRLRCTDSFPSARGSAPIQLGSTWLGSRLMMWQMGPTVLTHQLTGCWHGMLTVHVDVIITSGWHHPWHAYCTCWCHLYPGQSHGSAQLVFGSGQPIRAKKTRGTRFRRPILTLFSPVASSLPPLHNGMVKTQFWQLLFLSKNQTPLQTISSDTNCREFRPVMFWYLLIGG